MLTFAFASTFLILIKASGLPPVSIHVLPSKPQGEPLEQSLPLHQHASKDSSPLDSSKMLQMIETGLLPSAKDIYNFISEDSVEFLKLLKAKVPTWSPSSELIDELVKNGKEALTWFYENGYSVRPSVESLNIAASSGFLSTLVDIHEHAKMTPDSVGAVCAAANGHLEILRLIYEADHDQVNYSKVVAVAISNGRLNILQWILEAMNISPSYNELNLAVECGHLDIVKFLYEKDPDTLPRLISLEQAAKNNHFGVLFWYWGLDADKPTINQLFEINLIRLAEWRCIHNHENLAEDAVKEAIAEENTRALEWMHKLKLLVVNQKFVSDAINGNHEKTLNWTAHKWPKLFCEPKLFDRLADKKYWDILSILVKCKKKWRPNDSNIDKALQVKNVSVLEWLLNLRPNYLPTQEYVNQVALDDNMEILRILYSHSKRLVPDVSTITKLYFDGRLKIIDFLYKVIPGYSATREDYNLAVQRGHDSIVKYVDSHHRASLHRPSNVRAVVGEKVRERRPTIVEKSFGAQHFMNHAKHVSSLLPPPVNYLNTGPRQLVPQQIQNFPIATANQFVPQQIQMFSVATAYQPVTQRTQGHPIVTTNQLGTQQIQNFPIATANQFVPQQIQMFPVATAYQPVTQRTRVHPIVTTNQPVTQPIQIAPVVTACQPVTQRTQDHPIVTTNQPVTQNTRDHPIMIEDQPLRQKQSLVGSTEPIHAIVLDTPSNPLPTGWTDTPNPTNPLFRAIAHVLSSNTNSQHNQTAADLIKSFSQQGEKDLEYLQNLRARLAPTVFESLESNKFKQNLGNRSNAQKD